MKINKIIYTILLFGILFMMISPYKSFANTDGSWRPPNTYDGGGVDATEDENKPTNKTDDDKSGGSTGNGNSNKGLPPLSDIYKPTVEKGLGGAQDKIVIMLKALTVVGIGAVVVGIALIGFGSILGSAGEKAEAQTKLVGIVIAGIVIVGGSTIAQFIIKLAESINV